MYRRTYEWDDKNQLIKSQDDNVTVCYTYGSDGQRASKYTENSETLYTNDFWVFHVSGSVRNGAGIINKNIYLGKMRVVTKVKEAFDAMEITERQCQYFYHSDHLGSAQLLTDNKGNEYQRIEYTPYGETWVEKTSNTGLEYLPYKFTAKELDEETGLYYYGARYLDPKYSMWISTDPALSDYMAGSSAGCGGVFNHINFNLYHYGGNNPIKYTDPDGKYIVFKLKENGRYGLGSYYHNFGYCHLVTKVLTNFIPFGGYILNLEKHLTNIDPTANFTVLYDSDTTSSIVNESNIVDSVSFTKAAKNSKFFGYASWIYTGFGVKSSINDFKNDRKIEKFMASLSKDPFRGCLSDSAAINLGQTLADGALYYYENESRMKQKGISETDWAEKIRSSTNNIWGNAKFKTFEELENM